MTDIVERLRYYAKAVMPSYPNDVCSQAADEIERLREAAAESERMKADGQKDAANVR